MSRRLKPSAAEHDRSGVFALENLRALHEAGYLSLTLPRAYGGEEADVFDIVVAQQILARGDPASALVVGMALNVLGRQRDERLGRSQCLPHVCRDIAKHGGAINTCATEADLGSISRGGAPAATATPTAGGYLHQRPQDFRHRRAGPALVCHARASAAVQAAPHGEVASALVAAGSPGLTIRGQLASALSLRACGNSDVDYDDVFVAEDFVVERRALPAPGAARSRRKARARPASAHGR